jgi:hypothetical protein
LTLAVFAGQSNMGGPFMDASTLTTPWTPDPLTVIWNEQTKAWEELQPGVNTGYANLNQVWGPEVEFAREFRAQFPNEILRIVKLVAGGTGLAYNPAPGVGDWSPQSPDELFAVTQSVLADAGATLHGLKPDVVFWGQGEEDATTLPAAQAYGDNLGAFFSAVRAQWMGNPNGQIEFFQINTTSLYAADVRAGEQQVDRADPNAASFDTAGYPVQTDNLHFTAVGYDMVGHNFFQIYKTLPGAGAEADSGTDFVIHIPREGGTFHGTPGADVFGFAAEPFNPAHITGFTVGQDRLDFSPVLQQAGYAGSDPQADRVIILQTDGAGGTEILFDRDGPGPAPQYGDYVINLDGVPVAGLTWAQLTASGGMSPAAQAVQGEIMTLLRWSDPDFGAPAVAQVNAGQMSQAQATAMIVQEARDTTSVATLSYEFFTGKAPTAAGLDYLVSPTGPNGNNLNSAYYQAFSLENRYINFAVNLGKLGEGNAAFTAAYGNLSLFEATRTAYAKIFGEAPSDTKLHAILDPTTVLNGVTYSRSDYFAYYGQDGANGIGAKAAMVGWLLGEAEKADLGTYALSNDAFLTDVALHGAPFGVDLVGQYAQPGFIYHPE